MTGEPVISLKDVRFAWRKGEPVLDIAAFELGAGESVFLSGRSGSGKSTLLGILCGVMGPSSGEVRMLGQDLTAMRSAQRDQFRADHLGVIFQMFNLLPYLTVRDNVTLPCRFSASRNAAASQSGGRNQEARRLLERLGVGPELHGRKATALSVGQQQRTAVARALIGGPELILADEPTSALDADTRDAFIALLKEECAARGSALVFVSHDAALASHFNRHVDMDDLSPQLETA